MMPIDALPSRPENEIDLASLASRAAIELDNLLLGRSQELGAIHYLVDKLTTKLPQGTTAHDAMIDMGTAVALRHALVDTPGLPSAGTMNELLVSAAEVTNRLRGIVAASADKLDEIRQLRAFCVALSREVTALHPTRYERPEHPFRR